MACYPVISIRQPWAALILLGIKDVENRSWPLPEKYTNIPVFLHSCKNPEYDPVVLREEVEKRCIDISKTGTISLYDTNASKNGCILGIIIFGNSERNQGNPYSAWCDTNARFWWKIKSVSPLRTPIPAKGRLGFWQYEFGQENIYAIQ